MAEMGPRSENVQNTDLNKVNVEAPRRGGILNKISFGRFGRPSDEDERPIRTSISYEAYQQLFSWGLTESDVEALTSRVNFYDYGKCDLKLGSIKTGYEGKNDRGQDIILLPHFSDAMGRGDGNCADTAAALIFQLGNEDFLESRGLHGLSVNFHAGLSNTHFCREGQGHVWVSIAKDSDQDGKLSKEEEDGAVILDPSFQRIVITRESGYKVVNTVVNPKSITSPTTGIVNVTELQVHDDGNFFFTEGDNATIIVGVTNDREFAVGLGFINYHGQVSPYIKLVHANGEDLSYFFDDPINGSEIAYYSNANMYLNPTQKKEVGRILDSAQKIKLKNEKLAPRGLRSEMVRKWD